MSNGSTNGGFDPRAAWTRLGTAGKVATAAVALCVATLGMVVPGLVRALLAPSAETQSNAAGDEASAKKYVEKFPGYLAQIEGRSLFMVPGPPATAKASDAEPPLSEPGESPKPTSYGGPAIIGMMNDAVWFENGKRLVAGGDKDGDLRVVSVNIPWEATLEWQAVEFKVGLFTKDNLVVKERDTSPEPEADAPSVGAGEDGGAAGKVEAIKAKEPSEGATKVDLHQPEVAKPDAPKVESPKPEAPKVDEVKPEAAPAPASQPAPGS